MRAQTSFMVWQKWAFVTVFFVTAVPLLAQVPAATILGVVKDSSGAVVPEATITVRNVDTDQSRTTTSAADGSYRIPALPTGHYDVKAEHSGFRAEIRQGLTLDVSDNAVVNFTLQVGTTIQEVTVTAEAPMVNTVNSALGGLVNEQKMSELPLNGRNYMDLSLLQPGVTQDRNFGNGGGQAGTSYSANGAPVRSNNFTLDGAPVGTMFGRSTTSESGNAMGVDGIKEFKVITSNFSAEYGMAMGSQMAMVSRNGTNQFHGDVFEYLRNSTMDARNFFDTAATSGTKRLPPFQRNNYGGAFGGPLKRDKTFFFGVYEGVRQNLGVTSLVTVPAAGCHGPALATITNTACPQLGKTASVTINPLIAPLLNTIYPSPNVGTTGYGYPSSDITNENYGQMRVDQNFSAADSGFVRYTIQDGVLDNNGAALGAIPSSTASPLYRLAGGTRNQFLSLVENHIFSPGLLNTARLSFSRTAYNLADEYTQNLISPQLSFREGFPTGRIFIGSGISSFSPAQDFPAYGIQNVYTFSDDVFYTRAKHALKFGTLINRYNDNIQQTRSRSGIIRFGSLANFLRDVSPTQLEMETPGSDQTRSYVWNTLGLYLQDDWRVSQRLTLNLGLRYEFMTLLKELYGREAAFRNLATDAAPTLGPTMRDRTHLNFSPRLGFAYDLTGHGTTSLRGGFGIYYDLGNIGSSLEQTALATEPFSSTTVLIAPAPFTSLPLVLPPGGLVPQGLDYNAYQPHLVQYNLTVEHQLPHDLAFSISYAGSRGAHLWTILEGNPEIPTVINGVDTWTGFSPRVNQNIINSGFGTSVITVTTASPSWYNSLQAVVAKRLSHGLQFQSAYTYGKVEDIWQGQMNSSDCSSSAMIQPENPFNLGLEKGPACFDTTHNWRFNLLYHFPTITSKGFVSHLINGWWIGNIVSVQSGYPFSPAMGTGRSNSGNLQGQNERPDIVTAASIAANPCSATNPCAYTPVPFDANSVINPHPDPNTLAIDWFNPNMFEMPPTSFSSTAGPGCTPSNSNCYIGQLGNAGRNILRGPGLENWDFSLVKDTKVGFLGEAGSVQFRVEVFNILNHPNFAMPQPIIFGGSQSDTGPYSEAPNLNAGQITQTIANNPRQIQLALKVIF